MKLHITQWKDKIDVVDDSILTCLQYHYDTQVISSSGNYGQSYVLVENEINQGPEVKPEIGIYWYWQSIMCCLITFHSLLEEKSVREDE